MTVDKAAFLAHVERCKALDAKAAKAVDALWEMIDTSSAEAMFTDLSLYLPLMADEFGKAAAVEAAEFFDECRLAAKAGGAYTATTAKGGLWRLDRDIAYAQSADFAYTDVQAFLKESMCGVVRDYGRETMRRNSRADRTCSGYHSVPTASKPCMFCVMKALDSYYNYHGKKLEVDIKRDAWHNGCKCELLPVWKESPHWAEGDYEKYEEMYLAGRAQAMNDKAERGEPLSRGLTAAEVQAGMRRASGISH